MRKVKKYLHNSLNFFATVVFWSDVEDDFHPTILGLLMCILAPITIIIICCIWPIRYFILVYNNLKSIERSCNNEYN